MNSIKTLLENQQVEHDSQLISEVKITLISKSEREITRKEHYKLISFMNVNEKTSQ